MKIVIPGKPIPKARARYSKRGKHVIAYDPQEKEKKIVRALMTQQLVEIFDVTSKCITQEMFKICQSKVFSVDFTFYLPINQSDSVRSKNMKLWGITKASAKPDYDNLEKFYLDCANGILWDDDSSVVKASAKKLYSEEPRVEIIVKAIEQIQLPESVENVIALFSPKEFIDLQEIAKKIVDVKIPTVENINDDKYVINLACLLSELALSYSQKLNKITKLGDITSEVKSFEDFKTAL